MAQAFTPTIRRVAPAGAADSAVKRGKKLLSERRFDEAFAEFESALRQDPNNLSAHLALGRLKARQGDLDGALRHFRSAIEIDPTKIQTYLHSGRVYLRLNQLDKARESFENALRLGKRSDIAHAALGVVCARTERWQEALEHWKAALNFNPRLLIVRKRLALLLHRLGQPTEAMVQIKAAIRIKPDDPVCHAIQGRFYLLDKDYENAQAAYERAVELDPEGRQPLSRLGLAEVYIATDRLEQAERILNTLPPREQLSALVHKLWGDLYTKKGLHKEALEEYRSAGLLAGETLDLEGLELLDLLADDAEDERWEELALSAQRLTAELLEQRRQDQGLARGRASAGAERPKPLGDQLGDRDE